MRNKKFTVLDAIGNTPLIRIRNVYAKLESVNPSGSIKDRVALEIIEAAEREGELRNGYTIVEASSGNTGISLSMVAAAKGYKIIIVMPENMSEERKQMMRASGAELRLTSKSGSLREAIDEAEEIARGPKTFIARQFSNINNIKAQEKTGKEILDQIGPVDAVVAGVGTGGTLMGISNVMKSVNPNLKVIAVEPEESALMGGKPAGAHEIQGIGEGFIPDLICMEEIDEVVAIKSQDAKDFMRRLAREEGLFVGISSGANVLAALSIAEKMETGATIVTILPDSGERYLSMNIF